MRLTLLILVVFLFFAGINDRAEARRRHRKFKGVIIVNQILRLKGKLTRNGEDAPEFSGVKQGDMLETSDNSEAVIRIPGLGIFRMGANTKMKLAQFNERSEARFELLNGDALALFRRPGSHEFKLNHSVIKLHGTTFFVQSGRDAKSDKVCLCDGKIQVTVTAGDQGRKTSAAATPSAQSTMTQPTTEPAPTPTSSPLYHATLMAATPIPGTTPKPEAQVNPNPPAPTPSPLPKELEITSSNEHKQCDVSEEGITMVTGKGKLLELHNQAEIKELESLYALP